MEGVFGERLARMYQAVGQVDAAMAVEAFQPFAEEQRLAAPGGDGDGIRLAAVAVAVVRRTRGDEGALEGGEGLGDRAEIDDARALRKGRAKERRLDRLAL